MSSLSTDLLLVGWCSALAVCIPVATLVWCAAIRRRNNAVADVAWGPLIALAVVASQCGVQRFGEPGARIGADGSALAASAVPGIAAIWALRLAVHLYARFQRATGEDRRYASWRAAWGSKWRIRSLVHVFWFQAVLAATIGSSVGTASCIATDRYLALLIAGCFVALVGIELQRRADRQLSDFVARRAQHGGPRFCATGLWRFSRHPNYVAEVIVWLGIAMSAAGRGTWLLAAVAPAVVYVLVRHVSGVPLLERHWREHPDFAAWARVTPMFWPWSRPWKRSR